MFGIFRKKTPPISAAKAVSPLAVANYLLKKNGGMTQLKLLKLVYLCHGWSLGFFDESLVNEEAEAWPYGPIFPSIYRQTRGSGKKPVKFPLGDGEVAQLTKKQAELVDMVYDNYGDLSGNQLMFMSHRKGTPWHKVWVNGKTNDAPIPNTLIHQYYEAKVNA